jgi:hypothetical protein
MLGYFIFFSIIGLLLGKLIATQKTVFFSIIGISILWGLTSAPIWGLAAFGEMFFGYMIAVIFLKK